MAAGRAPVVLELDAGEHLEVGRSGAPDLHGRRLRAPGGSR
jgi:hypothetical protein